MKIGVITFSDSKDNYGQILQAYAMQEYLKDLGHNPFLIRYKSSQHEQKAGFKAYKILTYLRKFPFYVKWYLGYRKMSRDNEAYKASTDFEKRDFSGFISNRITATDFYDENTIHATPPFADAYICGSDQIWGRDNAYYLSFAPDNALKIAYAPSLGGIKSFSKADESNIKKLVNRLDKVGMREQSGVDTLYRMGINNAVKVIDPTLLLNAEDYLKIAKDKKVEKPYAFVYLLGSPISITMEEIANYVEHRKLDLKYVGSQGRNDNYTKLNPTIEAWLGDIANADCIITNSFHCTVFALQFHRPVITLPLTGGFKRMNSRVEELFEESGLADAFTSDLHRLETINYDFRRFEDYKLSQQKFSCKFLDILSK